MATAAVPVYVYDDQGSIHEFQRGDALPEWAVEKISNPAVIVSDVEPEADEVGGVVIPDGIPSEDWKVDQLLAYAQDNAIDLGDAKKKADIVAVLTAPPVHGEDEGDGDSAS